MKYLVVFVLFALSLAYAGYYLYMFDKKRAPVETLAPEMREESGALATAEKKGPVEVSFKKKEEIRHLLKNFWQEITPEQLKKELKSIQNINEARPDGQTMLHLLARYGQHPEMVSLLISAGADITLKDKKNRTAFLFSVVRGEKSYEFAQTFLQSGADIDAPVGRRESSPLMAALFNRADIKLIKLLLDKGANPNFQNNKGTTPLMRASIPHKRRKISVIDPQAIQLLLDYKADISIKDKKGRTALDWMRKNKDFIQTDLFKKLSSQTQ